MHLYSKMINWKTLVLKVGKITFLQILKPLPFYQKNSQKISGEKITILFTIIISIIASLFEILTIKRLGEFIQVFGSVNSVDGHLPSLALALLLLAFVSASLRTLSLWVNAKAAQVLGNRLSFICTRKLFRQPLSFHSNNSSSKSQSIVNALFDDLDDDLEKSPSLEQDSEPDKPTKLTTVTDTTGDKTPEKKENKPENETQVQVKQAKEGKKIKLIAKKLNANYCIIM